MTNCTRIPCIQFKRVPELFKWIMRLILIIVTVSITGAVFASPAQIMPDGVSVPSDFPHVDISINDNPDSGYIFIDNRGGRGTAYNIIFDNTGSPVWYQQTPDERRDFKVQPNGWITMVVRGGYGGNTNGFIALDSNYNYVKSFRATNGYTTDEHELRVLPDSSYYLIGLRRVAVTLKKKHSEEDSTVTLRETCLQGFTKNDSLIFEWPALEYFNVGDTYSSELSKAVPRFPHMNAIDFDTDGHILLSSRHTSEITKINRTTGEIVWRLSSENPHNSDFTFVDDPLGGFSFQHAIRALGNNRYSMFDNHNYQPSDNNPSRAVIYELDTLNWTATMVWQFQNSPIISSHYMGNAQLLPNGNMLINWAISNKPKLTEVRPEGVKAFEMNFEDNYECYRVHRCVWQGVADEPYLMAELDLHTVTLLFNQFGDTLVDYYQIYADTHPNPVTRLDTSKKTLKKLLGLENDKTWYFRVTAINKQGQEGALSNEVSVNIKYTNPGGNLIQNGDFGDRKTYWAWETRGSAEASWSVGYYEAHIQITRPGTQIHNIQLRQNGIPLINGTNYRFEFDARADAPRIVEIKVGQDISPWTNYSEIGYSYLTARSKHFTYDFKMNHTSDDNARVVINTGTDTADVYIDNLSLINTDMADIENRKDLHRPQSIRLVNYPNPFNAVTTITYDLPVSGRTDIAVYNARGERIEQIEYNYKPKGHHVSRWDAASFASGIYWIKIRLNITDEENLQTTRKILYVK